MLQDKESVYNGAYIPERVNLYPTAQEQLGILWHDIDKGLFGETAKQSVFYNTIKQIKNAFPKPTES